MIAYRNVENHGRSSFDSLWRPQLNAASLDGRMAMRWLRSLFGDRDAPVNESAPVRAAHFIYVKIPESLGPIDRGTKYEDPLDDRLRTGGLGEITGGGSQLGDEGPDGSRAIEFCGIDVDLTELERGLALLRDVLVELAAPTGTELHYEDDGVKLQDELSAKGWLLRRPRSFLHPGFGI
jgi:hypothetical protein